MNANAIDPATTCVAIMFHGSGRPWKTWIRNAAMVVSPSQPSASEDSVMPSCVPDM
jgi:hypothetical protein